MVFCFNKYSKISINILSFIICCLIFLSFNFISNFIQTKLKNLSQNQIQNNISISENVEKSDTNEDLRNNNPNEIQKQEKYDWALQIPKIDLYAQISEGTDEKTLNKYIGHFEESKKISGNVCLAAHNRGYPVNYFERLKELKVGDEIFYFVNEEKYKYIIDEIIVIYETDWTVIENTEDDRITLITCIENRDAYRLCVRGIKKE